MNIKLYHYTDKNIKNKIKVKYFAENFYTNNDKKASNTKRSFFFTNKNIPEYRFENLKYCYIVKINKNKIYDLKKDINGYIKKYNNINDILKTLKKQYSGIRYNVGYNIICLFKDIKYIKKIKGIK